MTPPAPERTGSWFSGERKTECLHWGDIEASWGGRTCAENRKLNQSSRIGDGDPQSSSPARISECWPKKKARDCKIRHGGNCPSQRTRLCFIPSGRFSCWILEGHVRAGKCVFPASFSGMLDLESTSVRGDTISCSASYRSCCQWRVASILSDMQDYKSAGSTHVSVVIVSYDNWTASPSSRALHLTCN